ncbi:MAG TPA: hypothetical protein VN948_10455 [Terriglobales bacterium]|nr:hypothetical protein [Terriglobales bacterium]
MPSILTLKDATAYQVYYEILTGQRKGSKEVVAGELDTLKDAKKMALLGFQEGIGFVPFAGIGYTAIQTIMKDDSSPVRAAAARVLADDPTPQPRTHSSRRLVISISWFELRPWMRLARGAGIPR